MQAAAGAEILGMQAAAEILGMLATAA